MKIAKVDLICLNRTGYRAPHNLSQPIDHPQHIRNRTNDTSHTNSELTMDEIDWTSPLTYLPLLPALVILYRIYSRTMGGTTKDKAATALVTLPNGLSVYSHQKGETEFLYKEVWEQREYAHKKFSCYDKPNAVIFDVGANIGMFSMFAAKECAPHNITLHSFEPMPQIHALCQANVTKHCAANAAASVHRLGLSNKAGEATFNFHPNFSLHSSGVDDFEARRTERLRTDLPALLADMEDKKKVPWWVACLPRCCVLRMGSCMISKLTESVKVTVELDTVSAIIEKFGIDCIDLLKVDVEGCEEMVLEGIAKQDWKKIQHATLEVEDFAACKRVTELLESKGFVVESEASERKANARVSSEVSQVWAWRE